MTSLYKDTYELFNLLWSEERVEHILNENWDELSQGMNSFTKEIQNTFQTLKSLNTHEQKENYVSKLPKQLKNYLLVYLARDLRTINRTAQVH